MQLRAITLLALSAAVTGFSLLPAGNLVKSPLSKGSIAAPFHGRQYSTKLYESISVATPEQPTSGGTASISSEIFNLVKGIVGAGVLSLPAGIAAFGNAPSAVIPAVALVASIGALSAYGFSLIGRVCSYTGANSYREAWSKSIAEGSSWLPAVSCTFKTSCAVLAYSMILADTTTSLVQTAGYTVGRTPALLAVTSTLLLPLCWMKNLSSLAPFSLLGSLGMCYTAIAMAIRYFGKAYAVGGKFVVANNFAPKFGNAGAAAALSPNVFILVSMLSTAYMAHFNAPKFYKELKNNTVGRFNTVVFSSFGISILLFSAIASLGFLTFGSASNGLILNNYANADGLMSLSRIAVFVSLVFSYPLVFNGVRDGVLDMLNMKDRSNKRLNLLTVACLSGITGLALVLRDVSFVLAFGGATLGNALIYIFPALMFRGSVDKMKDAPQGLKNEVKFALGSAGLGLGMGVLGAKMALKSVLG